MQAVIDGRGFTGADCLVEDDLQAGRMTALIEEELSGYGYHRIQDSGERSAHVAEIAGWLCKEAKHFTCETDLKTGRVTHSFQQAPRYQLRRA